MADCTSALQTQVQEAYLLGTPISIQGGGSKFAVDEHMNRIDITQHTGIVEYDPSELVIVVRAGTPLKDVIAILAEQNQILGFEPPFADDKATVGGMVATGFAGSARPYRGGVRDFVLGAKIINGKGEVLQFGGKVMKNVAGFDLFRPMAGAMGTLGVLLEVSLRLTPKPQVEQAVSLPCESTDQAIARFTKLASDAASLSAAHWFDSQMVLRFSGTQELIDHDLASFADAQQAPEASFIELDERRHNFFKDETPVYRCDLPAATPDLKLTVGLNVEQLIDWGGAQRFIKLADNNEDALSDEVVSLGGRIIKLPENGLASPLLNVPSELQIIHQKIKASFDPAGILNTQWTVES